MLKFIDVVTSWQSKVVAREAEGAFIAEQNPFTGGTEQRSLKALLDSLWLALSTVTTYRTCK